MSADTVPDVHKEAAAVAVQQRSARKTLQQALSAPAARAAQSVVVRSAEEAEQLHAVRASAEGKTALRATKGADRGISVSAKSADADAMRADLVRKGATFIFGKTTKTVIQQENAKDGWKVQSKGVPDNMREEDMHARRNEGTLRFIGQFLRDTQKEKNPPRIKIRFDSFKGMGENQNANTLFALLDDFSDRMSIEFATEELAQIFKAGKKTYTKRPKREPLPRPDPGADEYFLPVDPEVDEAPAQKRGWMGRTFDAVAGWFGRKQPKDSGKTAGSR